MSRERIALCHELRGTAYRCRRSLLLPSRDDNITSRGVRYSIPVQVLTTAATLEREYNQVVKSRDHVT